MPVPAANQPDTFTHCVDCHFCLAKSTEKLEFARCGHAFAVRLDEVQARFLVTGVMEVREDDRRYCTIMRDPSYPQGRCGKLAVLFMPKQLEVISLPAPVSYTTRANLFRRFGKVVQRILAKPPYP